MRCGRGRRVLCPLLSLLTCVCCRVQDGNLPLHYAAQNNKSEAVIKALLDAYPDAAKERDNVRCGRGRRVLCPLLSLLTCVCCRVQDGNLPLHYAAQNNKSEAVIKALLDAYPDAAKAESNVRCGRVRRVLCPLLSHSSHMRSMPSPPPLLSRRCADWEAATGLREDGRDQGAPRGVKARRGW